MSQPSRLYLSTTASPNDTYSTQTQGFQSFNIQLPQCVNHAKTCLINNIVIPFTPVYPNLEFYESYFKILIHGVYYTAQMDPTMIYNSPSDFVSYANLALQSLGPFVSNVGSGVQVFLYDVVHARIQINGGDVVISGLGGVSLISIPQSVYSRFGAVASQIGVNYTTTVPLFNPPIVAKCTCIVVNLDGLSSADAQSNIGQSTPNTTSSLLVPLQSAQYGTLVNFTAQNERSIIEVNSAITQVVLSLSDQNGNPITMCGNTNCTMELFLDYDQQGQQQFTRLPNTYISH